MEAASLFRSAGRCLRERSGMDPRKHTRPLGVKPGRIQTDPLPAAGHGCRRVERPMPGRRPSDAIGSGATPADRSPQTPLLGARKPRHHLPGPDDRLEPLWTDTAARTVAHDDRSRSKTAARPTRSPRRREPDGGGPEPVTWHTVRAHERAGRSGCGYASEETLACVRAVIVHSALARRTWCPPALPLTLLRECLHPASRRPLPMWRAATSPTGHLSRPSPYQP